jgi:hypothetical protein
LVGSCTTVPKVPTQSTGDPDIAAQKQAEIRFQNSITLMKQQCHGVINNCICVDDRGLTVLAPDGKLQSPNAGGWQHSMCGMMVFIPDKDHPHP